MESSSDILALLEQIPQPVFLVRDHRIAHLNHAARMYQLKAGTPVSELIAVGEDEYRQFEDGRLLLTLKVENIPYNTSVIKVQEYDLFCLESEFQDPGLRILALAAQNLRKPLSSAMIGIDTLKRAATELPSPTLENEIAALTKTLYQLSRIVSNMSDAAIYDQRRSSQLETRDAVSVIKEIVEKAASLTADSGYRIDLKTPNKAVYCLLDSDKLERALLNLISNALKYSPIGSSVHIVLLEKPDKLYLTVQNGGEVLAPELQNDLFHRFLREPGLENDGSGMGLGLTLIRGAATAHNGAVLISHPVGEGLKFTISFSRKGESVLRSPLRLPVDYAGGFDRALIELADFLPLDAFK